MSKTMHNDVEKVDKENFFHPLCHPWMPISISAAKGAKCGSVTMA